jgi:hypothetical protein
MDAHESQFYEFQPAIEKIPPPPKDPAQRKAWLSKRRTGTVSPAVREALTKWYGADKAAGVRYYEAFEICEYGSQPDEKRIRELFPMLRR